MDETDLAILREMFVDRAVRLGGIDPRITAPQIARILRLSHTTVRARMRTWSREGFFEGYGVFPNPELLGLRVYGQLLVPSTPTARRILLENVSRLPDVVMAWETDPGDLWLAYLGAGPEVAIRGGKSLSKITSVRVNHPAHLYPMPACDLRLSPSDWRIAQAVRSTPMASLRSIAHRLGVSFRTVRRRFDRMIDGRALLYSPRWNHSKTAGALASVAVHLTPEADLPETWNAIHHLGHQVLPMAPWAGTNFLWDLAPDRPDINYFVSFFTVFASPAESVLVQRRLESVPGVRKVEVEFPFRLWDFSGPFDRAIAAFLSGPRAKSRATGPLVPSNATASSVRSAG